MLLTLSHFTLHTFHFTLFFSFSFIFTRYFFNPQIANANRGGSNLFIYLIKLFFLYWLNLITLENKTEMKKYNIKGQKDTQKKKKRKMADVDCKGEKVPAFLSVRKILRKILKKWLNLIQFCCVWILALSHQSI